VFDEVGIGSAFIRRGLVTVGTCSARSAYCRDMSSEVGIMSGHVRQDRLFVGT